MVMVFAVLIGGREGEGCGVGVGLFFFCVRGGVGGGGIIFVGLILLLALF